MELFSLLAMVFVINIFYVIQKYQHAESRKLTDKKKKFLSAALPILINKEIAEDIIRKYLIDFGYNIVSISENRLIFEKRSTLAKSGNWIVIDKSESQFDLKLYFKSRNNIVREDFQMTIAEPINFLLKRHSAES